MASTHDVVPAHEEPADWPGDPVVPLEDEVPPGQAGPGLAPRGGADPTLVTAAVFIAIGYTPVAWWEAALGFGHFGPLQLPAILAMVGVLFAFIAVLRSIDLQDRRLRAMAGVALGLGLVRLFLLPWA